MIFEKIQEDIENEYEFYPWEGTTDVATNYIKEKYPGNYTVAVSENLLCSFIFDTPADATWFMLKYS